MLCVWKERKFSLGAHPERSYPHLIFLICTDQMTVENLLKHTAYQIQIRHRSIRVLNPLWSDWSPVVTVPAGELTILEFGTWSAV